MTQPSDCQIPVIPPQRLVFEQSDCCLSYLSRGLGPASPTAHVQELSLLKGLD